VRACAYAISTRCWAVCRARALEWSGLSSPGACTTAHRSFKVCCRVSRKLNEFFGPLLTCGILRALTSAARNSLALKSTLLNVAFENLEPADLDCFNAVRIIRVSGEKPVLDTLCDCAYVSCSVSLSGAPEDESEPVSPLCSGLAAVQMKAVSISLHCGYHQSYHCIVVRFDVASTDGIMNLVRPVCVF
jgi:hypothetical protein